MIGVLEKTAGGVILSESTYIYDVFDRRIAKTVNGQTLFTVYDKQHAWADYDSTGQVVARYLFGDGTDQILTRWRPGSGTTWYLTDRLGTVRDLVNANGAVLNHLEYSSFGVLLSQTNPAAGDRFLFTGREFDFETGLYYYRARYYDPRLGRFIGQDPISFAGLDANLYRYANNSPTNHTDPLGLMTVPSYGLLPRRTGAVLLAMKSAAVVAITNGGVWIVTSAVSVGPAAGLLATFVTIAQAVLPYIWDQYIQPGSQRLYEEITEAYEVISTKISGEQGQGSSGDGGQGGGSSSGVGNIDPGQVRPPDAGAGGGGQQPPNPPQAPPGGDPPPYFKGKHLNPDYINEELYLDQLERHGDPRFWTFISKKGGGPADISDYSQIGARKIYEVWKDAFNKLFEVHYDFNPDGSVSNLHLRPYSP